MQPRWRRLFEAWGEKMRREKKREGHWRGQVESSIQHQREDWGDKNGRKDSPEGSRYCGACVRTLMHTLKMPRAAMIAREPSATSGKIGTGIMTGDKTL